MNATNSATSVDEKCHFKYVHAAWAIKDKEHVCMGAFEYSMLRTLLSQRLTLLTQPCVKCVPA